MHLLSPPISRGDLSTFMGKSFFSFVCVNVMHVWTQLILVLISVIYLYFTRGGGVSDRPIPFALCSPPLRALLCPVKGHWIEAGEE